VSYKEGKAIVAVEELADSENSPYEEVVTFDVRDPGPNKRRENMGRELIRVANELERSVCRGDADTKKRYYEILEVNKKDIMKAKR
jgi:hypothetical protein